MHLGLEVHLDAYHESSGLVFAIVIDGAAKELTYIVEPIRQEARCGQSGSFDLPAGWDRPEDVGSFRKPWLEYCVTLRPPRA